MSKSKPVPTSAVSTPTATIDDGVYAVTELVRIRISPDNRKRFNPDALNELAASIKDIGVAQPILIRPVMPTEAQPEEFEVVAGERRFRASTIAGMTTIPTMIRSLTDLQAAKIRILENLQREDPHPMEEADGYQQLMLTFGYSADQLADEVKKSRAYIYGRLKLCALANDVREQFLENKISASIALLIARIPLPKLQAQALAEVTQDRGCPPAPMSYRAAAGYIQGRYQLNLVDAVFSTGDAKLMPAAGSCASCPKRSGNQPDVMEDLKNADVCTDPDCFKEKRLIHFDKLATSAEKKGIPVLDFGSDDARKLYSNQWQRDSEMVRDTTSLVYFDRNAPATKNYGQPREILEAAAMPAVATYIKGDDGALTPWYDRKAMQAALETAGACETVEQHAERMATLSNSPSEEKRPSAQEIEREKANEDRERRAANETAFRVALYRKLRLRGKDGFGLASLRDFAKLMVRDDNNYSIPDDLIGDVYPFERGTDDAVCAYIDQASLAEVQLILVDLALGESLAVDASEIDNLDDSWQAETFKTLEAMAAHEGINPELVRIDLEMATVALENIDDNNIGDFIRVNPQRINELKDFIVAERPHMLAMLEAAALVNGLEYSDSGFQLAGETGTEPPPAPIDIPAPSGEAQEQADEVACEGEDLAAVMEEAAPIKQPASKKASKKAAAPAAKFETSAWPFPKSRTGTRVDSPAITQPTAQEPA